MKVRFLLAAAVLAVAALPAAAGSALAPPMCNGLPATVWGGSGTDTLYGSDFNDVIVGLGGDDTIYGYPGDDTVCGGDGNDTIWAGEGTNRVWGDAGNDVISGGSSFDTFYGGAGNDLLDPGLGAKSRLYGQGGADRILLRRVVGGDDQLASGGPGRDTLDLRNVPAAAANTWVVADFFGNCAIKTITLAVAISDPWGTTYWDAGCLVGLEVAYGTPGRDYLGGDDGNNLLRGEAGNDELSGRGGSDRLIGGTGNDSVDGGAGTDTCVGETTSRCE